MNIEILARPGSATARIALEAGEEITAEGGAMIAMSETLSVETSTRQRGTGGVLKALKRLVAGESMFLNHFRAQNGPGEVFLATTLMGDMMVQELTGPAWVVQGGSFVASTKDVDMDASWQGFGKAAFSGESAFWLRISGQGQVVLSSFGAIYPIDVDGAYIVDTGHIVAFEETLDFKVTKAGKSWLSSFLGGEGLVCRFEGKGRVYCQSHNEGSFGTALGPMLKPRSA